MFNFFVIIKTMLQFLSLFSSNSLQLLLKNLIFFQARKIPTANGSVTKKAAGPSEEAIKKYLMKKEEEKKEWLERLKVAKPPKPKPKSKSKTVDKKVTDGKHSGSETKKFTHESSEGGSQQFNHVSEKAKKKDVYDRKKEDLGEEFVKTKIAKKHDVRKKDVYDNDHDVRKKDESIRDVRKVYMNEEEVRVKKDASAKISKTEVSKSVPSFSKYADLLALANQNASKPSSDWLDPDAADRMEAIKKKKKEKDLAQDRLSGDLYAKLPSKKRKTDTSSDYGPSVKKAKNKIEPSISTDSFKPSNSIPKSSSSSSISRPDPIARNPSSSKYHSSSAKISMTSTQPKQSSYQKPISSSKSKELPSVPPPARKGIAAQLSKPLAAPAPNVMVPKNGLDSSGPKSIPSHKSKEVPSMPTHGHKGIAAQLSKPQATPVPKVGVSKSSKSNIVGQTTTVPAKRAAMSVTMEDADSNFIQYSRKRDIAVSIFAFTGGVVCVLLYKISRHQFNPW